MTRRRYGLKGMCALSLVIGLVLPATGRSADQPAGFVAAVKAQAHLERSGQSLDLSVGSPVFRGDRLVTGAKGRIKVLLSDDAVIALGAHSQVLLSEHLFDPSQGVRKTRLELLGGAVRVLVQKMVAGAATSFEVRSGTAVAGVRGTEFVLAQLPEGARLITLSGAVNWSSDGAEPIVVAAGQASQMSQDQPRAPTALAAAEIEQVRRMTDTTLQPGALAWNLVPDRMVSGPGGRPDQAATSPGLKQDPARPEAVRARAVNPPEFDGGGSGSTGNRATSDFNAPLPADYHSGGSIDDAGKEIGLEGNWANSVDLEPGLGNSSTRLVIRLHRK